MRIRLALYDQDISSSVDSQYNLGQVDWVDRDQYTAKYNIGYDTSVPALFLCSDPEMGHSLLLHPMNWGILRKKIGKTSGDKPTDMISLRTAKAETISESPSVWKDQRLGKRCVIVCNGYYEIPPSTRRQYPRYVTRQDGNLLLLAGLYDLLPDDQRYGFVVVTTNTQSSFTEYYDYDNRPAFLMTQKDVIAWLHTPSSAWSETLDAIVHNRANDDASSILTFQIVSHDIREAGNESPNLIQPFLPPLPEPKAKKAAKLKSQSTSKSKSKSDRPVNGGSTLLGWLENSARPPQAVQPTVGPSTLTYQADTAAPALALPEAETSSISAFTPPSPRHSQSPVASVAEPHIATPPPPKDMSISTRRRGPSSSLQPIAGPSVPSSSQRSAVATAPFPTSTTSDTPPTQSQASTPTPSRPKTLSLTAPRPSNQAPKNKKSKQIPVRQVNAPSPPSTRSCRWTLELRQPRAQPISSTEPPVCP